MRAWKKTEFAQSGDSKALGIFLWSSATQWESVRMMEADFSEVCSRKGAAVFTIRVIKHSKKLTSLSDIGDIQSLIGQTAVQMGFIALLWAGYWIR